MIDKELLELVLSTESGMQQEVVEIGEVKGNTLHYKFRWDKLSKNIRPYNSTINLDTLGRKCKEWISLKGYKNLSGNNCLLGYSCSIVRNMSDDEWTDFVGTVELEAIIRATGWVRDERGEK